MGILNVTPDSFYDGGRYNEPVLAFEHGMQMLSEGAGIIDVGGESTRPNFTGISEEEELNRVLPLIKMLNKEKSRAEFRISIDTTKAKVAMEAVKAGADIINDISAMENDSEMLNTVLETGVSVVLQHMQKYAGGKCSVKEVCGYLQKRANLLLEKSFKKDDIFLDPGIGFGKTQEENLTLISQIDELCALKFPVLLGVSRKSYIGKIAGLENSDRLVPTVVSGIIAAQKGVSVLRVHDVKAAKESLLMLNAIIGC